MKHSKWLIVTAITLVLASAILYAVHYAIFKNLEHIEIYLLGDLAFLPLEVLLVAVVIERLLALHERGRLLRKLNMVIGTFFSELGTRLLGLLTPCIRNHEELRPRLAVTAEWAPRNYRDSLAFVRTFDYAVDLGALDLNLLRRALVEKQALLMTLLANPNLLEHERFTDLLWAIEHFMEELAARPSLDGLPDSDRKHLAGDVRRVYALLTGEWLLYCQHLQSSYPYIFSIIVRTHPLQERPDPTVR